MAAKNEHDEVRSVEEYLRLSDEDDVGLRTMPVAESVWLELLRRGYCKKSILLHKKLPIRILRLLSEDEEPAIRAAVADKRASAPLLATLATDESDQVRGRVACNAKAPPDLLELLARDPVAHVANAARRRLSLPLLPEPSVEAVIGGWDDDVDP